MAEPKTKPTNVSVDAFLKKVADPRQRADSFVILKLMKEITGLQPRMWGPTMVGFGDYHYKYASGHEGDCFLIGFSPRKGQMVLYFAPELLEVESFLKKLGKHKTGKCCLHIRRLEDVDLKVLRDMIETGFDMVSDKNQITASAKKKTPKTRRRS